MPKKPLNNKKSWTPQDDKKLEQLAKGNTPTRVISLKLKRTPGAVQSHAQKEKISLKPTNQKPYNRKK